MFVFLFYYVYLPPRNSRFVILNLFKIAVIAMEIDNTHINSNKINQKFIPLKGIIFNTSSNK